MRNPSAPIPTLFSIGHGYVSHALCALVRPLGWRVIVTTRDPARAQALRNEGLETVIFQETGMPAPPPGAFWLVSTPPTPAGCPAFAALGVYAPVSAWIGYLSATSVYGDRGGGWVIENTPPAPTGIRGRARLLAERQWAGSGGPAEWVRLPGIYGPGRSALDDETTLLRPFAARPGQVFSRVHVEDIARGLLAAMRRPRPGRVLHLVDDLPAPREDVVAEAARLLGVAPPPQIPVESANLSEMAASFLAENRRVGNGMTKAALGWRPLYPTYREGLAAIHARRVSRSD